MIDGITWEEETQARIKEVSGELKSVQGAILGSQSEIDQLKAYVDALERVLELDRQHKKVSSTDHYAFDPERLRTKTTWRNLLSIMDANNGILVAKDAVTILVDANVFKDREHARNVIYSTLYYHKKELYKVREGVYRFNEDK